MNEQLTVESLLAAHAGDAAPATAAPAPAKTEAAPRFRKGTRHIPRDDAATEKQTALIRKLLAEREGIPEAEELRARLNQWRQSDGGITKAAASGTIDALLKIEKGAPVQRELPASRPNQYPGVCDNCGRKVAAEAGLLGGKGDDGKWVVTHREGECIPSDFPFPLGRYAVEIDGVMKFFVFAEDGVFAQASDELYPLTGADYIKQVIALIAEDALEASKRYGIEFGECGRCGRGLTSEWRKAGIGPVCVKKGWGS